MTSVQLTEKQKQVLKRVVGEDFFICGLHGAKRSGKTFVNNMIFLYELVRVRQIADKLGVDEPMYILAGTSSTSIQNNILQELYNTYDIEPKYDKHGSFTMCGVKVIQVYTGSISGLKRARGFTAFGAYVNEGSLANQEVFKEIISRCSGEGARVIWDSNPDNPNHWLHNDYVDNPDKQIIDFRFILDDNTMISERYRNNIKAATPSGKFYDRDILGLWTVAEGAVYADYDESIHEVAKPPKDLVEYYAGVDWGYDHFGSIVIIGEDKEGKRYILDGVASQHKEIDWWVNEAKRFKDKYGDITFYADSARVEHIVRFQRERLRAVNAGKSVIPGIEEVARGFKEQTLFYVKGSIPRFEEEIYQYRWKENTTKDEVIKEYDDVLDALRYAIYSRETERRKGKFDARKAINKAQRLFR